MSAPNDKELVSILKFWGCLAALGLLGLCAYRLEQIAEAQERAHPAKASR